MASQCVILIFICCTFLLNNNFPVNGMFSAGIRRTQSIRPIQTGNKLNTNTRSGSLSSFSSVSSLPEIKLAESEPIASTSSRRQIDGTSLREADLHPLVKKAKPVRFNLNEASVNEASSSTHSGVNINPSRDGVQARVRSALLQFSAAVGIGTAIGAAGVVIDQRFIHETSTSSANTTLEKTVKDDDIIIQV